MSPEKLIRMANQIATFYASQPAAQQVPGVAQHLNDFWDPRMRAQLSDMVQADPASFHDLVRAAARDLRLATTP